MKIFWLILLFTISISAQSVDISEYLKKIESGEAESVRKEIENLKSKHPNDANILYLAALLTENGSEAVALYSNIYNTYPKSIYADDALFNLFSYYYSIGLYKRADGFLTLLKEKYPSSSLIKLAEGDYSDEKDITSAEETEDELPATAAKYKFTIQAGAFLNVENAKKLSTQFESDGYFTQVYQKSVGGSILNVVLIGQFETESDAGPVLESISKNHNLKGRVVPLN